MARRSALFPSIGQPLHCVLPVVQTPFTADLQIDRAALSREIDWAFERGADEVWSEYGARSSHKAS